MTATLTIGSLMESYITDGEFAQIFPEISLESVFPANVVDGEIVTEANVAATWASNAYRVLQTLRNKIQMFIAEKLMKVTELKVDSGAMTQLKGVVTKLTGGTITADDVKAAREVVSKAKSNKDNLVSVRIGDARTIMGILLKAVDRMKSVVKKDLDKDLKGAGRDAIILLNQFVNAVVSFISVGISNAGKSKKDGQAKIGSKTQTALPAGKEDDEE